MRHQIHARHLESTSRGLFAEAVVRLADVALRVPGLSLADRQMLYDLKRSAEKLSYRPIERALALVAGAPDGVFAKAVVLLVDIKDSLASRRARAAYLDVRSALAAKSEASAGAAPLQLRAALTSGDTPRALLDSAIEQTDREVASTSELGDALRQRRFQLIHGGAR